MNETLDPPRHRLTIGDIMGLVVASAFSVFLLETCFSMNIFTNNFGTSPGAHLMDVCGVAGGCLLLPFAFALPLLGIRDNRIPRREIVQEMGFVSCVVVAVSAVQPFILFSSRCVYAAQHHREDLFRSHFEISFQELKMQAGPAILGAWVALALAGRWRVKSGWIDLAGCLVGLGFFLLFLYAKVYNVLLPFL